MNTAELFWRTVGVVVLAGPAHQEHQLPRWAPRPSDAGFRRSTGCGKGVHWRLELPDGRGIHVRDSDDRWHVHWDHVDPKRSLVNHARCDYPPGWVAGCVGTCSSIGASLGAVTGGVAGAAVGALLGLIVGTLGASLGLKKSGRRARRRRQTEGRE